MTHPYSGLAALRRHDVDWNALTTVHAASQEHGRAIYQFLRDDLRQQHA